MSDQPTSAVPRGVALLRDFVNTREPQEDTDRLTTPGALHDWCVENEVLPSDAVLDTAALQRAIAVREGLRAIFAAHAGHRTEAGAVESVNEILAEVPLTVTLAPVGVRLAAHDDRPLARLVAAIAEAVRETSELQAWPRLKVCARDTCQWAFYDSSRNQARRWCSMAGCGNHIKMKRAYAKRTRGSA